MKKILIIVLAALFFTGCEYKTVSIKHEQTNALQGKTITYVHKNGPVRPQYNSGGTDVTMKVVTAITSEIVAKQNIGPIYGKPSDVLSKKIISLLIKKYNMKYVNNKYSPESVTPKSNISKMKKYNTDYVLEINTEWGIQNANILMGTILGIINNIRLIDRKNMVIVAQLGCTYDTYTNKKGRYNKDDYYAYGGKLLKEITSEAIDECIKEVKAKAKL